MKVKFDHFSPNAVEREGYKEGVDYLRHQFDLEFDDTLHLLKQLKNHRSSLDLSPVRSLVGTSQQPIESGTLTQDQTILSTAKVQFAK